MNTIKGILNEDKDFCDINIRFTDARYEVYSYAIGDGIWGLTYSYDDLDELEKLFGKEKVNKLEGEDVEVDVPFSLIEQRGYSILDAKTKRNVVISVKDYEHMATDSIIELPNGKVVEPDSEESPLIQNGLI